MPQFLPDKPVCFVQGRRGEVYAYQGHGERGFVWSPSLDEWREVGVDAPTVAPTITQSAGCKFYVARIDILDAGSGYEKPPTVQIGTSYPSYGSGSSIVYYPGDAPGATASTQAARAVARIQDGYIGEIEMQAYGKGYTEAPPVTIGSPIGLLSGGTTEVEVPDITASQNNFSVTAGDIYLLKATAASVSITGITGPNFNAILRNVGTYPITLTHEGSSSFIGNRFISWNLQNIVLQPGYQVSIAYDGMRWQAKQPIKSDSSRQGPLQAYAKAVVRAHLRGKYRCYYRYVNDQVPEAENGPLYSSLSPETLVDCGDGKEYITWSGAWTTPPAGLSLELWRTTSNQATTLFRVAKYKAIYNEVLGEWGGAWEFGGLTDSMHDWELADPDRAGFLVMPILLPNGELNANRFGVPSTAYSTAVMFQDRLWMGVDTAGGNPNTLVFSEADEPESMPDINELILQSNLRSTDYITALVPYAGAMVVMQSRHCHRLQYVSQPLIDAGISMLAYRGCLNQRCWDIMGGILYSMDEQGIYSMEPNGNTEDLTLGIVDKWRDQIDFSAGKWFSVRADKKNNLLRVLVRLKSDNQTSKNYPTTMLVYCPAYKAWWEERHPAELICGAEVRDVDGQVDLIYGTSKSVLRRLNNGLLDIADWSIYRTAISNPGLGYTVPPSVRAGTGNGAEFEAVIDQEGRVTAINVKTPGFGYNASGPLIIDPPPSGGTQCVAIYEALNDALKPVYWHYKSSSFEFVTDAQDKRGGVAQTRQVSVTYRPTDSSCIALLKAYYNNGKHPRCNVVKRDRGVGFTHSDELPGATVDMAAQAFQGTEQHGVASALFYGRTIDDMQAPDRHINIALSGQQSNAGAVQIHNVDIYGVTQKQSDIQ